MLAARGQHKAECENSSLTLSSAVLFGVAPYGLGYFYDFLTFGEVVFSQITPISTSSFAELCYQQRREDGWLGSLAII